MPMGVTDGSNALPGQVGEFFTANTQIAYQPGAAISTTVGIGTLPPGDWNIWTGAQFIALGGATSNDVQAAAYYLNPLPPGFSQNIGQEFSIAGETVPENMVMAGIIQRANTTVPTALVFTVTITPATTPGAIQIYVMARRMR